MLLDTLQDWVNARIHGSSFEGWNTSIEERDTTFTGLKLERKVLVFKHKEMVSSEKVEEIKSLFSSTDSRYWELKKYIKGLKGYKTCLSLDLRGVDWMSVARNAVFEKEELRELYKIPALKQKKKKTFFNQQGKIWFFDVETAYFPSESQKEDIKEALLNFNQRLIKSIEYSPFLIGYCNREVIISKLKELELGKTQIGNIWDEFSVKDEGDREKILEILLPLINISWDCEKREHLEFISHFYKGRNQIVAHNAKFDAKHLWYLLHKQDKSWTLFLHHKDTGRVILPFLSSIFTDDKNCIYIRDTFFYRPGPLKENTVSEMKTKLSQGIINPKLEGEYLIYETLFGEERKDKKEIWERYVKTDVILTFLRDEKDKLEKKYMCNVLKRYPLKDYGRIIECPTLPSLVQRLFHLEYQESQERNPKKDFHTPISEIQGPLRDYFLRKCEEKKKEPTDYCFWEYLSAKGTGLRGGFRSVFDPVTLYKENAIRYVGYDFNSAYASIMSEGIPIGPVEYSPLPEWKDYVKWYLVELDLSKNRWSDEYWKWGNNLRADRDAPIRPPFANRMKFNQFPLVERTYNTYKKVLPPDALKILLVFYQEKTSALKSTIEKFFKDRKFYNDNSEWEIAKRIKLGPNSFFGKLCQKPSYISFFTLNEHKYKLIDSEKKICSPLSGLYITETMHSKLIEAIKFSYDLGNPVFYVATDSLVIGIKNEEEHKKFEERYLGSELGKLKLEKKLIQTATREGVSTQVFLMNSEGEIEMKQSGSVPTKYLDILVDTVNKHKDEYLTNILTQYSYGKVGLRFEHMGINSFINYQGVDCIFPTSINCGRNIRYVIRMDEKVIIIFDLKDKKIKTYMI